MTKKWSEVRRQHTPEVEARIRKEVEEVANHLPGSAISQSVGVRCKSCDQFITFGDQIHGKAVAYDAPDDPILCPHCGERHEYTNRDVIDERGVPAPYAPRAIEEG